jgi:HAD superfamily hydrolase (TIGR01509 family)
VNLDWVLFDADGVIQTTKPGWLEDLTSAGGDRGEDFVLAVFAAEQACVTGQDFRSAMEDVLRDFAIDRPLEEVLDPAYWIEVDPTMLGAVRGLRDLGVRCALATNQQNLRGTYMRGSLGFADVFDDQFYSWELGVAKPDLDYFRAILDKIATVPERVLFLDDREDNISGALTAGLRAELFPRDGGLDALHPILARHGLDR